ncbi:MAG: GxxExxY protein [Spirochaetales bacterium]|nr:GxxExxY protein [Spirochaetales bacterium]
MSVLLHRELSDKVLGALFSVHNILGPGLLESAYEGALVIEFKQLGISVSRQKVYPLHYKGELAGGYIADMVVDSKIIVSGNFYRPACSCSGVTLKGNKAA